MNWRIEYPYDIYHSAQTKKHAYVACFLVCFGKKVFTVCKVSGSL